ncbi:hypothetical protein LXL04_008575 [Taraxacum kok-saghyz]
MAESSNLPPQPKKSNKIRDIVRLQQMLKKWKKTATSKNNNDNDDNGVAPKTATKGLNKFLKKTLSFSDISGTQGQEDVVRKGYLAVWVGRDEDAMKKFVIPTDYLTHQAFSLLLRDAEEEFGFQQEGILKIPCDIPLFENILKTMTENKKQQQRPTLKSSSSTSSFFLYDEDNQQSEQLNRCTNSSTPPPRRRSSNFDAQLKTPPTTPSHHLPLYCR